MIPVRWLPFLAMMMAVSPTNAAIKPNQIVTINAMTIAYASSENQLLASENVLIEFRNYTIRSKEFEFNSESRYGIVSGNIEISGPSQNIKADLITYDGLNYIGTIQTLHGRIGKLIIAGDSARITPEKIMIKNASVTGCDSPTPDYIIRSSQLDIYPQWGVLISFDNWVSIGSIPSLWMPTFIYGSRNYSLLANNSSVPELGGNPIEGGYVRQKFGYFINQDSHGAVTVALSQNLGAVFAASHLQRLDDHTHLNIRTALNGSDGPEYQVVAGFDLGYIPPPAVVSDDLLMGAFDQFNPSAYLPAGQAQIGTTLREIINDSRVSKPYFVSFQLNPVSVISPATLISSRFDHSNTQERSLTGIDTASFETGFSGNISHRLPLSNTAGIDLNSFYYGNFYSVSTPWQRWFGRVAISDVGPMITAELSMTQKFWGTDTISPFEFERKYAIQGTEVGAKLLSTQGTAVYGVEVNYDIDNRRYRTVDFLVTPQFHCWRLPLRWKTVEGQFTFGVELF